MPKIGRPTKYKPEYCALLVTHMEGGLSFESFAGLIGVNIDTLYEWASKRKPFSEAKKRGNALSLLWWEQIGRSAMLGIPINDKKNGKPILIPENFNTTMWIFAMKNRHGWRDRHEVETRDVTPEKAQTTRLAASLVAQFEMLQTEMKATLIPPPEPEAKPTPSGLLSRDANRNT